jgi:hypothetical protein
VKSNALVLVVRRWTTVIAGACVNAAAAPRNESWKLASTLPLTARRGGTARTRSSLYLFSRAAKESPKAQACSEQVLFHFRKQIVVYFR